MLFGCRSPELEFLHADELRGFADAGVTGLQMAFSRGYGQPKTYVQDLVVSEQDHVWDLIAAGAVIYVCGNARTMAPAVRAALSTIYQAKTGGSESAAQAWLSDLTAGERFLEDIWGETAAGL